ncbi:MAG: metal ABC transporter substrate-binding protein [Phycisphaerae bacterium]
MRSTTTVATILTSAAVVALAVSQARPAEPEAARLRVVATLPDYADLARTIGGDRVAVQAIVRGDQDAHFIRPKPSFVDMAGRAKVLITTGLDLEMWLPTVIDKSGNTHIRSGQPGYVAVAEGIQLLEKPAKLSRAEGGVHIYGNPHLTCSPVNMKTVARNIATGLIKNDPEGKAYYQANLDRLLARIDERLFGDKLPDLLGAETLCRMAHNGTLVPFLQEHDLKGKPLADYAGGWLKKMRPLWGTALVTYHKNWVYFLKVFGMEEAGTVEPKPGIPPTPKHVNELVTMMKERHIRIILAANYFDEQKIRMVASRVGAEPVIVPLYVGGEPEATDYFALVDLWIDRLLAAAEKAGMLSGEQEAP